MTENNTDNDERIEQREQFHSGVSVEGKMKMGSGTRDQATVKLKGKGRTAEEACTEFEAALDAAEEGEWGHRLLSLNPENDGEDDDDGE